MTYTVWIATSDPFDYSWGDPSTDVIKYSEICERDKNILVKLSLEQGHYVLISLEENAEG